MAVRTTGVSTMVDQICEQKIVSKIDYSIKLSAMVEIKMRVEIIFEIRLFEISFHGYFADLIT